MVGYAKAAEIAFTGRTLTAAEALEFGPGQPGGCRRRVRQARSRDGRRDRRQCPLAVRAIKRMMRAAETETFEQNVHHVFLQLLPLLRTDDFSEGVRAFMEKRTRVPGRERAGRGQRAGLAPRRAGDHPCDPPIHRRSDPRRRSRDDPVARAGALHRVRTVSRSGSSCCATVHGPIAAKSLLGEAFRAGWEAKRRRRRLSPLAVRRLACNGTSIGSNRRRWSCSCASSGIAARSPYEGRRCIRRVRISSWRLVHSGYGGALTMWHLGVEAELRDLLDVPGHVALSACITLGVPEGTTGR